MAKQKQEIEKQEVSIEMLKAMVKDYPFDLVDMKVEMQDEQGKTIKVFQYKIEAMENYRYAFIKKYEQDVDDCFVFEKFSTIWTSDNETPPRKYKTGYFCPKSFFDNIEKRLWKEHLLQREYVASDVISNYYKKYRPEFMRLAEQMKV